MLPEEMSHSSMVSVARLMAAAVTAAGGEGGAAEAAAGAVGVERDGLEAHAALSRVTSTLAACKSLC